MEKFTKEEKELLEQNPNIQAVLSNQVLYTKDFKEKAVIEYRLIYLVELTVLWILQNTSCLKLFHGRLHDVLC